MTQDDARRRGQRDAERDLLYACLRDLASTAGARGVLERLLDRILEQLGAAVGAIRVRRPDGSLCLAVGRGLPPQPVEGIDPGPEGVVRGVDEGGEAIRVADLARDPRFLDGEGSCLAAPLRLGGRQLGVMEVRDPTRSDAFDEADLRLLVAVADCAAAALGGDREDETILERARRDALTGLANHARFWSDLEVEFQRAERHRHSLGLVMVDMDDFKAYNDRLGHPAGDDALATVARILESGSRAHDVVARYGGEEFAVLLPETDAPGAVCYAEKMRRTVEAACFGPGGAESLTVSVGVATSEGEVASPRELVALAEERLERAKADGRNQVCADLE